MRLKLNILFLILLAYFFVGIFLPLSSVLAVGISPGKIEVSNILKNTTQSKTVNIQRDPDNLKGEAVYSVVFKGDYAHYISGSATVVIPDGQQSTNYTFEISPQDAPVGDYQVFLDFIPPAGETTTAKNDNNNQVKIGADILKGMTLTVNVHVTGEELLDYEVSNLQARDTEVGQPIYAGIDVDNQGNVEWRPDQIDFSFVDATDENKIFKATLLADKISITKPGQKQTLNLEIDNILAIGQYYIQAQVYDQDKSVANLSSQNIFSVFPAGTLAQRGELISLTTNKELYVPYEKIKLSANFKNTGEIAANSILITEIYKDNTLQDLQKGEETLVDKGENAELTQIFSLAEEGIYTFSAVVEYGSKITATKTITVQVKNAASFWTSAWGLSVILGLVIFFILIGVLLYRYLRNKRLDNYPLVTIPIKKNRMFRHWIFGIFLFMVVSFGIMSFIFMNSQADDVSTSTTVGNVDPAVDSIYISSSAGGGVDSYGSGIVLLSGTTKTVHVNGVVSDNNGKANIANTAITVIFYRSGATGGADCSADNNDCYQVSGASCTLADATDTTRTYTCPLLLQFYADATDSGAYSAQNWLAKVIVTDNNAATGNSTHGGVEVNSLTALTIPSTVDYGSLALNETTTDANNVEKTIFQAGNSTADVNVSSSASMVCSSGSIPVGNQTWALTDVAHGSGTVLSGTPTDTNLGVTIRTSDITNTSQILYWGIQIPVSGVGGSCGGTTYISAIAG